MTTTEEAVAGARRLAKSAALRTTSNGPRARCPFPFDGTPTQRTAAVAWAREYNRRRRLPVDFSSDLDALAGDDQGDDDGGEA